MAEIFDDHTATNLYFDKYFNTQAVKLLPGEYYVTKKDILLVTVLGSCVAACIRDRQSGLGGMNHFMLPENGSSSDRLLRLGALRTNLEAKVFGGGNVISGLTMANVGQRNADFVLNFLETEKIPVTAQDLVDIYPRKVYFFPKSNKVLVKKLKSVRNNTITEREKDYSKQLNNSTSKGGEVELFS